MADDRLHMMRALALAERGMGKTAPNPMVGCVIVRGGAVVGEGWHAAAGAPHAEVRALDAAGGQARGSTAYVTLEPCNHQGRTPPCAEALLAAGIAEVVYGLADPNPVAAGGAAYLRERGVEVRSRVCEKEARLLNRFWLHVIACDRPYVVAKFAASLDGKIATASGESKWITGPEARARAHELRRRVDAIVVGASTVVADDPALTARDGDNIIGQPLRVVLDSAGRTPPDAAAFGDNGRGSLLATTARTPPARLEAYRALGTETLVLEADRSGRPDVVQLMSALKERGVCGVMVEGGAEVLGSFFDAGLVDEVWAFIAPVIIGGAGKTPVAGLGSAILANAFRLKDTETEHFGQDILVRGFVERAKEEPCSPAS